MTTTPWTAPAAQRIEEPLVGAERPMLEGWLDWHRQTLLGKCAGLTAGQLAVAAVEPSSLTLLGLLRHMSAVERLWFRIRAGGMDLPDLYDSLHDGDFSLEDADAERDYAAYLAEVEAARTAAAGQPLEHEFVTFRGNRMSLRWVYLHMIEEYARHNGHADLLRERIDGATGY